MLIKVYKEISINEVLIMFEINFKKGFCLSVCFEVFDEASC